jgi:hypothetical protein
MLKENPSPIDADLVADLSTLSGANMSKATIHAERTGQAQCLPSPGEKRLP